MAKEFITCIHGTLCKGPPNNAGACKHCSFWRASPLHPHSSAPNLLPSSLDPPTDRLRTLPSSWSHRKKAGGRWPLQQNLLFMFRPPSQILNFLSLFNLFSLEKEKIKGLGADAFWTRHFLPWENSNREGLHKDAYDWGWGRDDETGLSSMEMLSESLTKQPCKVRCSYPASIPAHQAQLGYHSRSNESAFCFRVTHEWC